MDEKAIIIEKLIANILQTGIITLVNSGTLKGVVEKRSLYIVDNKGTSRFLGAIPYEIKTKTNQIIVIDEDLVEQILKTIEKDYTFEILKNKFEIYKQEEENRKENSKVNLEHLKEIIKFIEVESNGSKTPELKRHPREFYYYIDVKFNDGDLVRIYSISENNFMAITFDNYMTIVEKLEVSKSEIIFLLKEKINRHFALQAKGKIKDVDNAYAKEMREVRNSRIKVLCEYILNGKMSVIFKISDGYQCISNKKRFRVGDNKDIKEYDVKDIRDLEEYIKRMNIKWYYILKDNEKDNIRKLSIDEINGFKLMFL